MTALPAQTSTGRAGVLVTFRESPREVKALLAGILVNKLGAFLQVFLVLFLVSRGFGSVRGGLALGAYGLGSVAGVLFGGTLSARVGPRWTIGLSMAATAPLLISVLYVPAYPVLVVVVAAVGAVSQVYRPAATVLLAQLTPERRQVMIFAMSRLALNVGTAAAPIIGAALASISFSLLFWGEALTSLTYGMIALLALPRGIGAASTADEAADVPQSDKPHADRPGYRQVLADRRYVLYLIAVLVNSAVYVQYLGILPLAMRHAHLPTLWYGIVVSLNSVVVVTCELLMTTVVQHWRARVVLATGFSLLGGGIAVYALPGGLAVFIIGTLIWSLAEIIEGPTMFAYPAQAGPERLRAQYAGAFQAVFGVGTVLGPSLGVAAWSAFGNRVWIGCGTLSVLGLIPGLPGINPVRARANQHIGRHRRPIPRDRGSGGSAAATRTPESSRRE